MHGTSFDSARRFATFIERRAGLITIIFLLTTVGFAYSLRHLKLKTDFQDLLPEGQPSVVALRQIMKRIGGMGTLNVAIQSPDPKAAMRLAQDLVAALRSKMAADLHTLDYTAAPVRKYYEKNGVLYLDLEELKKIDQSLEAAITQAKLKANPAYVDLEGEADSGDKGAKQKDGAAELRTIEDQLRKRAASVDKFPEGWYLGEHGHLLAIFLRPNGSALEVGGARHFIAKLQRVVDDLGPRRYHPGLTVGFTGSIQVTVEEHETIARDLTSTSLLCISLVGLAVWLYFRRLRVLGLLGIPLVGGAIWAFGIATFISGSVNAQTAFLGSVIVGTGINYGILILARYLEERREGADSSAALATALGACFKPTLIAALATGIAFGGLSIAQIRSFSQFAFMGGTGMVICWIFSYTVLPALICLVERVSFLRMRAKKKPRFQMPYPGWIAGLPLRFPGVVVVVYSVLILAALVATVRFLPHSLETDINNLRNKPSVESGTNVLDNRVCNMMGDTLSPAVVLASSPAQALQICAALDQVIAKTQPRPPIDWCKTMYSFLPDQQEEKLAVVATLRERLAKTHRDLLPDDVRKRIDELKGRLDVRRLELTDLPDEIRRRFRETDGREGTIAMVAHNPKLGLYNVADLFYYTDTLRTITLPNGEVVHSSGDQVVFADILRSIAVDAPRTIVLAAVGVLVLLVLVVGKRAAVGRVAAALGAGMALMSGIAAAFNLKFNFFNFVALPTTLGIGVDYPINIQQRYEQDGPGSLDRVLRRTGPAVFIASLTTIIGYGVLVTSNSMALASFGKLAVVGEVTCLASALLLLPALSALAERRAARRLKVAPAIAPETAESIPAAAPAPSHGDGRPAVIGSLPVKPRNNHASSQRPDGV